MIKTVICINNKGVEDELELDRIYVVNDGNAEGKYKVGGPNKEFNRDRFEDIVWGN